MAAAAAVSNTTVSSTVVSSRNNLTNLTLSDAEARKVGAYALTFVLFHQMPEPATEESFIKWGKEFMQTTCDRLDVYSKEEYEKLKSADLEKIAKDLEGRIDSIQKLPTEKLIYAIYERCRKF